MVINGSRVPPAVLWTAPAGCGRNCQHRVSATKRRSRAHREGAPEVVDLQVGGSGSVVLARSRSSRGGIKATRASPSGRSTVTRMPLVVKRSSPAYRRGRVGRPTVGSAPHSSTAGASRPRSRAAEPRAATRVTTFSAVSAWVMAAHADGLLRSHHPPTPSLGREGWVRSTATGLSRQ
jgi:hypothetical protein